MFDKTLFISEISEIKEKDDGSYIVIKNDIPYHIPNNDEYRQEYDAVTEYISENNLEIDRYISEIYKVTETNIEKDIRSKRDYLLSQADILLIKYNEQVELGIITANETYRLDLLRYKQALRDIPKQVGFPNDVVYPTLEELTTEESVVQSKSSKIIKK